MDNTEIKETMTPLKRSFRHARPPHYDDETSLRIVANEIQTKGLYHNLCVFTDVEIRGYNPESILHQILEDHGMEKVVEMLNDLKSSPESDWKITIDKGE